MNVLVVLREVRDYSDREISIEKVFKPSQVAEIMNEKVIDIGLVYLHLLETKQLRR